MRIAHSVFLFQALASGLLLSSQINVDAFAPLTLRSGNYGISKRNTFASPLSMASLTEDCGCEQVVFSGKPSDVARDLDARQAIVGSSVLSVNRDEVKIDDLIGAPSKNRVSVVVFLRSLGWPLCQEFILQWSKKVDELEAMGVRLVMVSIGVPEKGKELIDHLGFEGGEKYLHVDPENKLYDLLKLNVGVKETFFTPSTPLAFLERFTKPDGTKELLEVLSKWNKAIFVPPKQSQAFNQGGTFVFDGSTTVFAHYDESTGAHSDIKEVLGLAKERAEKKANTK